MTTSSIFRVRMKAPRRMIGVVLPVVLVILTILTGLVVTQVRRGTIDERLAANTRESVMLEDAAQTALRYCEWQVTRRPRNTAVAVGSFGVPAWKVPANWTDTTKSLDFTALGMLGPNEGVAPACVIEDATCELQPEIGRPGMPLDGCNGIHPRWMKFRITSKVGLTARDLPTGLRETLSQSEVRLLTD
jgi:hypothetical protein